MAFQPFKRSKTTLPEVQQLQDSVEAALRELTLKELLDGKLIEAITITMGAPKSLNHSLQRPCKWVVVRKNAGANVWDSQDTNATPKTTLILNSSATVTVDLWVF